MRLEGGHAASFQPGHSAWAVAPCAPACHPDDPCDPPLPFHEFLEARNRAAREAAVPPPVLAAPQRPRMDTYEPTRSAPTLKDLPAAAARPQRPRTTVIEYVQRIGPTGSIIDIVI